MVAYATESIDSAFGLERTALPSRTSCGVFLLSVRLTSTSPSKTQTSVSPSPPTETPKAVPRSTTFITGVRTLKPTAESGTEAVRIPLVRTVLSGDTISNSAGP